MPKKDAADMRCIGFLLDLIYPPRCLFCGDILVRGSKCGCKLETESKYMLHEDAAGGIRNTDLAVSCFRYGGPIPECVHRFKFRGYWTSGRELAAYMADKVRSNPRMLAADAVVPVPSFMNRTRHGRILARYLSKELKMPFKPWLVVKVKKTAKQHEISKAERKTNLIGAFKARGSAKGLNILLCDDVLTSGETLSSVARELKAAGALEVYAVTFAKASK